MWRLGLPKRNSKIAACLLLLFCLPFCTLAQDSNKTVDPRLVAAQTRFGFKLFQQLLKHDESKNIFASPASVSIALSMTYNGAEAATKQAMAEALELQGMDLGEVNKANAALLDSLKNSDTKVELDIANSLWANKKVNFYPDFLLRNSRFYKAGVTTLDFGNPAAPGKINAWVSEKTGGKITKSIDNIDAQEILYLIDAVYFKGQWTKQFEISATVDKPFMLPNGRKKMVPMMSQSGDYKYYEGEGFQAVSLPYGSKRYRMYVFLTSEGTSLRQFYTRLTAENWGTWMSHFGNSEGSVVFPRFTLEYTKNLNEPLSELGMGVAFKPRANFSKMAPLQMDIKEVLQKTFVKVNEEGTEAVAITKVGMRPTEVVHRPPPFRMVVDHPFFCAIVDNKTGTILFMGSIVNPLEGQKGGTADD